MDTITNEDYAIFIHCENVPIITHIGSALHKFLVEMEKPYLKGTLEACEKLADEIIIAKEEGN